MTVLQSVEQSKLWHNTRK